MGELSNGVMAQSLNITEYPVPTAGSHPDRITAGPDGALWFTENSGSKIGRITTAGVITEYPVPTSGSQPTGITAGPDGALWFTEETGIPDKLGRITTSGVVTEYPVAGGRAAGITTGPDGALWFTESGTGAIGRITTAGMITEFSLFSLPGQFSYPMGITTGQDGALWFTDSLLNKIGRITTAGVITEFQLSGGYPTGITVGPDNDLWFTELTGNKIAKITTAGVITEYPVPTAASRPVGITVGPDNNLWFTETSGNKIGRASLNAMNAVVINSNGIVNNASFAPGTSPLAPGSIAAIFGSKLTDGSSCLAPSCSPKFSDGKLETTLDGAQVTVNDTPAPIFYTSPGQLGIQIPTELTGSSATVQVSVGNQTSTPQTISLAPAAPGIFFTPTGGQNVGALTHADGSTVNPQNPAQPGELVILYATGLGQVTPSVPTGALPPASHSTTVAQATISIDGTPVTPDFSGLSGCCVGQYQVNVRIPASTRSGDDIAVVLTIDGQQSNTVITSVRAK